MSNTTVALLACVAGSIGSAAMGQIIYDNKTTLPGSGTIGIVTHPGGMTGAAAGSDRSAIVAGGATFGFGAQGVVRLSDDFVVPAGETWNITGANLFGYLTGSTTPSATAATVQIFSTDPLNTTGGTVVGGDATTNVMSSNTFFGPTAIYRTTNVDTAGTTRRIQQVSTTFGTISLGPGTYWLDWNFTGVAFVPPLSDTNPLANTGNARQVLTAGGNYAAIADQTFTQGVPFQLVGTIVPAPSSLALLGLGGLVAARRRRS